MEPQDAIDIGRQAVLTMLTLSSPVLIAGMSVGLGVGLLQALTQIQEQTIAFVPKIVAMVLALSLTLPWMISRMVDYTREVFIAIPDNL